MVHNAFMLAFEAHDCQKSCSGEPFIIHPVEFHVFLENLNLTGSLLLLDYCMTRLKIRMSLLLRGLRRSLVLLCATLWKERLRCQNWESLSVRMKIILFKIRKQRIFGKCFYPRPRRSVLLLDYITCSLYHICLHINRFVH